MSRVVGIGDLSGAVREILEEYGQAAEQAIREAAPAAAKKARSSLKGASPVGYGSRHYAQGWAVQSQNARDGVRVVVYNKTKPGLTHLLEYGHALRGGGRSRAVPHIAPVNQAAQRQFVEETMRRLEAIR